MFRINIEYLDIGNHDWLVLLDHLKTLSLALKTFKTDCSK